MASLLTKIATVAVVPLFAGYLCAQTEQSQRTTTTTTTTMSGTLVDAGCHTTHTESHESSTTKPDENTTKTETRHSTSDRTDCPITTSTTAFGIMTPDGQFVRFDEPSNTRVVEIIKNNKRWSDAMSRHEPVKVRVVGTRNGNVVVVDRIQ
jgi:hypothetical protein